MSNQKPTSGGLKSIFASLAILIALLIGVFIYLVILGDASNFDAEGHPLPGNYLGMMYQGGFIVPILMGIFIIVVIFSIERALTIGRAKGKGNIEAFVRKIKSLVASDDLDAAVAECDKQQGSLANVVRSGIIKIQALKNENMDKESRVAAIQKEIEEATALELPMLSKNLVIISTCATIATLWGLIGTVLGMIRSFAALSNAGAPDTTALATGISEALINTALGITGSVVGIIMYNYFTTKIDAITYSMDEAGFTIVQSVNVGK
ncbi:MAG: MotA/TolQ/ExbB proton channel family protein [Bacteroidia bacterium]|nr:MotA/TolQ/ExbB proton channel family protein [Bacteroidia bacterium]MCZ2247262.1 MotA/TolQ/ExbB proton channel family protein [Bacteroidia bacterium]